MSDSSTSPMDPARIDRFFAGEAGEADAASVEAWLAANPQERAAFAAIHDGLARSEWQAANPQRIRDQAERITFAEKSDDVRAQPHRSVSRGRVRTHFPGVFSRFGIRSFGTTLAAGIVGGLLLFVGGRDSSILGTSKNRVTHMSVYVTGNGKQATVYLPDGSTAFLNVASRLEVPTDYDRGNRSLRLTGEALFDVKSNTSAPFTITTGSVRTRVLGTQFAVRHYAAEPTSVVTVRSGKVLVGANVVAASQEVIVGADGRGSITAADVHRFSFASGMLRFDDVPLLDAIPDLNRWYDADIKLGDPALAQRKISGGVKTGSLTDLSALLEMTFHIRVVRTGNILTLYPAR